MPSQCYYNGDWYACLSATSPGQSPGSHPEKWKKLEIPAAFERYLVQAAYAALLPGEGQSDKRAGEARIAEQLLQDTRQRFQTQNGNEAVARPNVRTR
jgi:hypothetical protein